MVLCIMAFCHGVIMLSVIMLNALLLNVMAPLKVSHKIISNRRRQNS